ncbi:hypothetical protein B0H13DRAFT_1890484 [Mycena leptocephala]|nr:hypothetical protein B0H13DRAFT_1890484 [Mycena leptocephala]
MPDTRSHEPSSEVYYLFGEKHGAPFLFSSALRHIVDPLFPLMGVAVWCSVEGRMVLRFGRSRREVDAAEKPARRRAFVEVLGREQTRMKAPTFGGQGQKPNRRDFKLERATDTKDNSSPIVVFLDLGAAEEELPLLDEHGLIEKICSAFFGVQYCVASRSRTSSARRRVKGKKNYSANDSDEWFLRPSIVVGDIACACGPAEAVDRCGGGWNLKLEEEDSD